MTEVHAKNIENAFHAFAAYLTGQNAFKEEAGESSCKAALMLLNRELVSHYSVKHQIVKKLLGYGKEISGILSYKNFELQVVHSLEQEDT